MQAAFAQTCQETYLPFQEGPNLLLFYLHGFHFVIKVTLSGKRGAHDNPISIVRVIVVAIAVVVHITEIRRTVSRTKPPIVSGR